MNAVRTLLALPLLACTFAAPLYAQPSGTPPVAPKTDNMSGAASNGNMGNTTTAPDTTPAPAAASKPMKMKKPMLKMKPKSAASMQKEGEAKSGEAHAGTSIEKGGSASGKP